MLNCLIMCSILNPSLEGGSGKRKPAQGRDAPWPCTPSKCPNLDRFACLHSHKRVGGKFTDWQSLMDPPNGDIAVVA